MALRIDTFQLWSELFKLLAENANLHADLGLARGELKRLVGANEEYKQQILQFCADHPQDSPTHPFPEVLQGPRELDSKHSSRG